MKPSNNFSSNPAVRQIFEGKNNLQRYRDELKNHLKSVSLAFAVNLMKEELAELCGPRFSRKEGELCHRTGSDPGSVFLEGKRVPVQKPRIRNSDGDEINLNSYKALRDYDLLNDQITAHMLSGVSTREYESLVNEFATGLNISKSTASKAFNRGSKKMLDELNGRSLSGINFVAIMIDGIEVGEASVIVAMGFTDKGKKMILGVREGSTENSEVVKDLFHNLVDRGLNVDNPMLFVLDGAKALKKAVIKLFGQNTAIQRCVRHKERNIISYLPEAHHMEFRRRWKKLHGMKIYAEAQKEYKALLEFLNEINFAAHNSLEEAKMETLTVIKLGIPDLLRKTMLSTNPIENPFQKFRRRSMRVTNWKQSKLQASRWVASSLLESEKNFRTIKGHTQIHVLQNALKENLDLQLKLKAS